MSKTRANVESQWMAEVRSQRIWSFLQESGVESGASQVCEPSMHLASLGVETFAVRLPVSTHCPWQPEAINKHWSYMQVAVLSFNP